MTSPDKSGNYGIMFYSIISLRFSTRIICKGKLICKRRRTRADNRKARRKRTKGSWSTKQYIESYRLSTANPL